jgi:hypothetical protein
LPAAGRPPESFAALPVPYRITFWSSESTIAAAFSDSSWRARGELLSTVLPLSFVTRMITRGLLPKAAPSTRRPPFAKAEKARAISSGLTPCAPSPIEKYGRSLLWIPSDFAVLTMLSGPTTFVSCAKTELSEYAVACWTLIGPRYSSS